MASGTAPSPPGCTTRPITVRVVNMSLGGPGYSQGLADAVAYAQAHGVLLVAAVGNQATKGNPVEYPAAFPGVIGVGATGYNGAHSWYSNTGTQVDIVAPGGSADGNPSHDIRVLQAAGTTTTMAGTSFASPTVAAAAALVLARNPALQPFQAGQALVNSAADLGSPGPDPIFGAGLLDAAAAAQAASTIASAPDPMVHRGGAWYLRRSLTSGVADTSFSYGNATDAGLMCDWDGNGTKTAGVFRAGTWYLRNSPGGGLGEISFGYGNPGDIPICGDWNGDGIDTPGVVRGDTWYLRNSNTGGIADIVFKYGSPGDLPIVGDWNGDGIDTPGVVRAGVWYLRNSNTGGGRQLRLRQPVGHARRRRLGRERHHPPGGVPQRHLVPTGLEHHRRGRSRLRLRRFGRQAAHRVLTASDRPER